MTSSCGRPPTGSGPGTASGVQVSGGSHPRYARHAGTDKPTGDATDLRPVRIDVVAGRSAVLLPRVD